VCGIFVNETARTGDRTGETVMVTASYTFSMAEGAISAALDAPLARPAAYPETSQTAARTDTNGYILPDSSTRLLADSDLRGLTKEELRLARNEIYARYGRQFNDESLQNFFNAQPWYAAIPKLPLGTEPALTDLEIANTNMIKEYEAR